MARRLDESKRRTPILASQSAGANYPPTVSFFSRKLKAKQLIAQEGLLTQSTLFGPCGWADRRRKCATPWPVRPDIACVYSLWLASIRSCLANNSSALSVIISQQKGGATKQMWCFIYKKVGPRTSISELGLLKFGQTTHGSLRQLGSRFTIGLFYDCAMGSVEKMSESGRF